MAKGRPARTLLEVCIARAGSRAGREVAGFRDAPSGMRVGLRIIQWALVRNDVGHFPTTVEYADWWKVDERTGWRHRAAIHELFPGDDFHRVVEAAAAAMRDRQGAPVPQALRVVL